MQTTITIMQSGEDKDFKITWKKGAAPEANPELRSELESLEDSLVTVCSDGISYVIDLGSRLEIEEVFEVFRSHGYDMTGIPLPA